MSKAVKNFLLFAFMGLLFGAMIGYLIACGYIGNRYGIPMGVVTLNSLSRNSSIW